MSESRTPTLGELLRAQIASDLADVHVSLPARVESYDAGSQKCSAQPLIKRGYFDEAGERQVERLPVVADVPVVFPGSGRYMVKFPIAVGDTVLLVFTSASLDRWLPRGGEVDPGDDRRHALSDAIAIPGLRDFGHAHSGNTSHTIEFTSSEIRVGGDSALVTRDEFNAHSHGYYKTDLESPGPHADTTGPSPAAVGTAVLKGG